MLANGKLNVILTMNNHLTGKEKNTLAFESKTGERKRKWLNLGQKRRKKLEPK